MTRLSWGEAGTRVFEAGVDRGVLYVDGSDGVPWNGLISVSENPSGGDVKSYYVDGIKYLTRSSLEEFQADIEAFTYPDEFGQCDGSVSVGNGLFATQQPRKSFGLSYRTKLGNDIRGVDYGYKIHLIYNAMAAPADHAYNSMGDSVEPSHFSWKLVTKPPSFSGYRPTAHFEVDTTKAPVSLVRSLEDILYGTPLDPPRLLTVPELISMFTIYEASIFDAGFLTETYLAFFDAGRITDPAPTATIDGGTL